MYIYVSGFSLMEQTVVDKEDIRREKHDKNTLYEMKFKLNKLIKNNKIKVFTICISTGITEEKEYQRTVSYALKQVWASKESPDFPFIYKNGFH